MDTYSHSESEDSSNPLNRSIEKQISEARKRVELYSQTLLQSREQEQKALQRLEEERSKWQYEFEKKTVIINELERELELTVETLEHERNDTTTANDSSLSRKSSGRLLTSTSPIRKLSDDAIDIQFRQLLKEDPIAPRSASSTPRSKPIDITSPIDTPAPSGDSSTIWNELLNQYKEQLKKLKQENLAIFQEKQTLQQQNQTYFNQIHQLKEEQEQYKIALQDLEGKYTFRSTQNQQLEQMNQEKQAIIDQLFERKNYFELLVNSLQQEVADITAQSAKQVEQLEHRVVEQSNESRVTELLELLEAKDHQILTLQHRMHEMEEHYSEELVESKQMISSLSLRLKSLSTAPPQLIQTNGHGSPPSPPSISPPQSRSHKILPTSYAVVSEGLNKSSTSTSRAEEGTERDLRLPSYSMTEPLLEQMKSLNTSLQSSWQESKRQVKEEVMTAEELNKSAESLLSAQSIQSKSKEFKTSDVFPLATNILQGLETKLKSPQTTPSRKKKSTSAASALTSAVTQTVGAMNTTSSTSHRTSSHHSSSSKEVTERGGVSPVKVRVASERDAQLTGHSSAARLPSQPRSTSNATAASSQPAMTRSYEDLLPTLQKSSLGRRDKASEPTTSTKSNNASPMKARPSGPLPGSHQALMMPASQQVEKPLPASHAHAGKVVASVPMKLPVEDEDEDHDDDSDSESDEDAEKASSPQWKQPTLMKISIKRHSSSSLLPDKKISPMKESVKSESKKKVGTAKATLPSTSPGRGTRLTGAGNVTPSTKQERSSSATPQRTAVTAHVTPKQQAEEVSDAAIKQTRIPLDIAPVTSLSLPQPAPPLTVDIVASQTPRQGLGHHLSSGSMQEHIQLLNPTIEVRQSSEKLEEAIAAHNAKKKSNKTHKKKKALTVVTHTTSVGHAKVVNASFTSNKSSSTSASKRSSSGKEEKKRRSLNVTLPSQEHSHPVVTSADDLHNALDLSRKSLETLSQQGSDDEGEDNRHHQRPHHRLSNAAAVTPPQPSTKTFPKKFTKPQIAEHLLKPTQSAERRKIESLDLIQQLSATALKNNPHHSASKTKAANQTTQLSQTTTRRQQTKITSSTSTTTHRKRSNSAPR